MEAITGYIEKLGFRQWLYDNHGIAISGLDGIQYAEGGTATETEALLASYDELPSWKTQKINEIKDHGLGLINQVFPAIENLDQIDLISELWQSIDLKTATGPMQSAISIYSAAKTGISIVNALADVAAVQAFDVSIDITWP